jgi:cytochrome c-type biogenesis protein CcmH/NrfF
VSRARRAAQALLLGMALVAGTAAVAAADLPPTQKEVESSLTCQCGCGLTVHSCNHLQCGSAEPMKKEIAERLRQGESKETILAAFTTKYGEKVLAAPTFHGFNWLAWITPFAAVLLAATVLTLRQRATPSRPAAMRRCGPGSPTSSTGWIGSERPVTPVTIAIFTFGAVLVLVVAAAVSAPLFGAAEVMPEEQAPDERIRWERQKRQALAAIKEVELDHGMGKLSDEDLATMRGRFEVQAMEAMQALEALERRRTS